MNIDQEHAPVSMNGRDDAYGVEIWSRKPLGGRLMIDVYAGEAIKALNFTGS